MPLLRDAFSPNTINTVPGNQSQTRDGSVVGDYVRRGLRPMAWRVGDGRFQLIDDPEGADEEDVLVRLDRDSALRLRELAREKGQTIEQLATEAVRVYAVAAARQVEPLVIRPWGDPSRRRDDLTPARIKEILDDEDVERFPRN